MVTLSQDNIQKMIKRLVEDGEDIGVVALDFEVGRQTVLRHLYLADIPQGDIEKNEMYPAYLEACFKAGISAHYVSKETGVRASKIEGHFRDLGKKPVEHAVGPHYSNGKSLETKISEQSKRYSLAMLAQEYIIEGNHIDSPDDLCRAYNLFQGLYPSWRDENYAKILELCKVKGRGTNAHEASSLMVLLAAKLSRTTTHWSSEKSVFASLDEATFSEMEKLTIEVAQKMNAFLADFAKRAKNREFG